MIERRRYRASWVVGLVLFLLALIPRLHAVWLGFVTPDEPSWVFRSIRFLQAVLDRRWADTLQTGHPGAITMWIGSLGVLWRVWRDPSGTTAHLAWIDRVPWVTPENVALFRELAPFLPAARAAMAALTALGVVLVYVLACRLWGRRTALLGALLLALDPFVIALSGLLHLDAPAMTLIILSLLTWLVALDERADRPLWRAALAALLSGLWAGLSVLAKGPAVLVVPVIAVATVLCLLSARPSWARVKRTALLALAWLLGAVGALFGAFPAMWADPGGVLQLVFGMSGSYFDAPLHLQHFMGAITSDPGPLFYPVVLLFRTTPVTLIGVLLSFLPLFAARTPAANRRRAFLLSLWVSVVGYVALLTVGAQKFDRYLLPVYPALNLLAAAGWMAVVRIVERRLRQPAPEAPFVATLTVLAVIQAAMVLPSWPYYMQSYNPLAGGLRAAVRTLTVGWGEGMEQLAGWVDCQPDAPGLVVATRSPVLTASLVQGPVLALDGVSLTVADLAAVTVSDRQFEPALDEQLANARPVYAVLVGGREMLWLYDTGLTAEASHLARYGSPSDLILCDAPSPFARRPSDWNVVLVEQATEHEVATALNEWSAEHTRLWYLSYPAASPITAASLRRQLDAHAVRLDEVDLGYATATLYILPDEPVFAAAEDAFQPVSFGGQIALLDGTVLPGDLAQERKVRFRLRWQAEAVPQTDYKPFIHLYDAQGHLRVAGRGQELLVDERFWTTSHWSAGDGTEAGYGFGLPPGLPPGRYQIAMGLSDAQSGGWVPALDDEGRMQGTTAPVLSVDVPPPWGVPDPAALQPLNPVRVDWGDQVRLLGYEHPSRSSVGQTIVVELYWQGLDAFDGDEAAWIALVDESGAVAYEQTYALSTYPTSRWRPGELTHALYDLQIPAELEGGPYRLQVNVLDDQGVLRGAPTGLGSIDISSQARTFELPHPPQYPLDLRLGDGIELVGYDLPQAQVAPRGIVPLTLYWRSLAPVEHSYTVFVHLLDPSGQVQGQQDTTPAGGSALTSGWIPGQVVVDEYALPVSALAPPGPHQIEVGMYDARDMTRLPIADSNGVPLPDNRVLLVPKVVVTAP